MVVHRHYPIGAEIHPDGVHFRIWAPDCQTLDLVLDRFDPTPMQKEANGYFSLFSSIAKAKMHYKFRINGDKLIPDPSSRYQPEGPHGPSEIVEPNSFLWNDDAWNGIKVKGQAIYELHIGTFTPEGTWNAAAEKLPYLKDLGITLIEMMPIADFPGNFGWGYDGVNFFAPCHLYGKPHDLCRFIDKAHALGLGVILDVVYNHFGPDGNYLNLLSKNFTNDNYATEWGKPINFDSENSSFVREFFIANAGYWIKEYHFDGLRLDATHNIYDSSPKHIISEIVEEARRCAGKKSILIFSENESQESILITPSDQGGYGVDSAWNDDFHHSAYVHLTGARDAYYTDYQGSLQELISALKYGYLYQGQYYSWQKKNRGTPSLDNSYQKYVIYLENHDQVANSSNGQRIIQYTDPSLFRMLTTLLLLGPQIPLLFQGQEFGSTSPFVFFADHKEILAHSVWAGRKEFLSQFYSFHNESYHDPSHEKTYLLCKLHWNKINHSMLNFHKDLLKIRANDTVFTDPMFLDGAVIQNILLLRYFGQEDDRLIICNFGNTHSLDSIADPLFAPPFKKTWKRIFSSQDIIYGGMGTSDLKNQIQGHTTQVWKSI